MAAQDVDHVPERMAAEVEADGGKLLVEFAHRVPRLDLGQARARGLGLLAEEAFLRRGAIGRDALSIGDQGVGGGDNLGAVAMNGVEGPCPRQAFQRPLVDLTRINALDEVDDVGEGAPGRGGHRRRAP